MGEGFVLERGFFRIDVRVDGGFQVLALFVNGLDADAAESVDNNMLCPVGHLEHLENHARRPDAIQVLEMRVFGFSGPLSNDGHQTIPRQRQIEHSL